MKILHLSHNGLPDIRVERAARTGKKIGHNISFAGPYVNDTGLLDASFERFYTLPFNRYANAKIPFYWGQLKRKLSEILKNDTPDIIHAHNVIAAKLASEFSIPFVYDDHEYASKQSRINVRIWRPNKMYIHWLWSRWEKEVLQEAVATITVSRAIAKEYEKLCNQIYVAPNFPSSMETKSLRLDFWNDKHLSLVYVGRDFSRSSKLRGTHRDVSGFLQIFHRETVGTLTVIGDKDLSSSQNVYSLGVLPHPIMMKELTKHHIGLHPRKKHWYHQYSNPNKTYEYAHAGLLVLTISDLVNVKNHLGKYCVMYNDPDELKEVLQYYSNNLDEIYELRPKIREFAVRNLTWEKHSEPKLIHAYSKF